MGEYLYDVKSIIVNFLKLKYKEYLNTSNLLYINENKLDETLNILYNNNYTLLKQEIRDKTRDKYKNEYNSTIVENIILDLFQDKDSSIRKIIEHIKYVQNINYLIIEVPIINESLNLNISNINGFIIINHIKNIENLDENHKSIFNKILEYKFIDSINNKILIDFDENERINVIKEELKNKKTISLGLYYLKNNNIDIQ
tara:strand:- start:21050 stop:21649 length:600 start_codon:yes stop_codon:yes gene_type:complete